MGRPYCWYDCRYQSSCQTRTQSVSGVFVDTLVISRSTPSSFCFQACIYRRKHGETEIFADNITLIIQDEGSNQISTINLQNNAGYNEKLLLVDFSKDNIFDIW